MSTYSPFTETIRPTQKRVGRSNSLVVLDRTSITQALGVDTLHNKSIPLTTEIEKMALEAIADKDDFRELNGILKRINSYAHAHNRTGIIGSGIEGKWGSKMQRHWHELLLIAIYDLQDAHECFERGLLLPYLHGEDVLGHM